LRELTIVAAVSLLVAPLFLLGEWLAPRGGDRTFRIRFGIAMIGTGSILISRAESSFAF
jgi:hypothetical protein